MKRKNFWVLVMATMLLTFAMVLVGCASSKPFVYDESVAPEQSSTLIIKDCQVYKFNGTTVSAGKWSAGVGEKTVIIPAGNHTLEVWSSAYGTSSSGGYKTEYGKVEMTHTFLPGRTYLVMAPIDNGYVKGQIINVPTVTSDLVPDPESPDATPIEGIWVNTAGKKQQWIFANNEFMSEQGNNSLRGTFTIQGEAVTANSLFFKYAKGGWRLSANVMSFKLTYNGATLDYYGTALKKVE
jgi:hypothetical protein